jgi:hypothetical protein
MSPHTKLALAVLGAVLTAAAAAYYAWWRGRELHREMDAVLDHLARFENNLIGEPGDPEGGELGRQARNLERLAAGHRPHARRRRPHPHHRGPADRPRRHPGHRRRRRPPAAALGARLQPHRPPTPPTRSPPP